MRIPNPIVAASEHAIGVTVRVAAYLAVSWLGGVAVQGRFALFITAQTLAMALSGLALDVANAVLVGRSPARLRRTLLLNSLATLTTTSTFTCICIWAACHFGLLGQFDRTELVLLSVATWISTFGLGLGGILIGACAFEWRAASAIAGATACILGLVYAATDGELTSIDAIAVWTGSTVTASLFLIFGAIRLSTGRWSLNGLLFKSQISLAMQSYPYFIGTTLLMRIGTIAVAGLLGPEQLGIFAVALAATEALLNLPRLFVPLVIGNAATQRGDIAKLLGLVHSFLLFSVCAAVPTLYFLLERLLPTSFSGVGLISLVLLAGTTPFGLGTLAANHLLGRGHGSRASMCAIVSAVAAFFLLPLGCILWGLMGAAVANVIVQTLFATMALTALGKAENLRTRNLVRPRLPQIGTIDLC